MEENKNNQNLDTPTPEFESNAARRLRLLGIENDDKIHDTEVEIKKGNFFSNLWYKHKWAVIISAFFIILAIALLCTIIFKDRPDLRISYNGPFEIKSSEYHKITRAFENLIDDYDGDGEIEVTLTQNRYRTAEEKKDADRESSKDGNFEFDESKIYSDDDITPVSNSLRMSEYNLVLIDKELYDKLKNNFCTLEEILGEDAEKYKDISYGDCGIYLKQTKFGMLNKDLAFLPNDTIIAICKPAMFDKNLDNEFDALKKILTYEQE